MRKVMLVVAVLMVMGLNLATASFAAGEKTVVSQKKEAAQVIKGKISAVNAAANQISVLTDDAKQPVTITTSDAASLKEGQRVKVTLKAGTTDQAESVKVIVHKKKK